MGASGSHIIPAKDLKFVDFSLLFCHEGWEGARVRQQENILSDPCLLIFMYLRFLFSSSLLRRHSLASGLRRRERRLEFILLRAQQQRRQGSRRKKGHKKVLSKGDLLWEKKNYFHSSSLFFLCVPFFPSPSPLFILMKIQFQELNSFFLEWWRKSSYPRISAFPLFSASSLSGWQKIN